MMAVTEKKKRKDLEAIGFPLAEEPQSCIVCKELVAYIPCLQCKNKICAGCLRAKFLHSSDQTSFILLHHIYCRHQGKPYNLGGMLPPLPKQMGHLVHPLIDI